MSTQTQEGQRKNYYEVLGLKENATQQEIDDAYKKLSRQYHPEKNAANRKEAEAKFHEVNEAYDVLSNHNIRSHYDEINHKPYTDKDADHTFERFYREHGTLDENQRKFFDQHYPNRKRTPYQVLGLTRNASQQEINDAYRKLAFQYHPKNNNDSAEARKKFNEVNEAFNHLRNDTRRHNYDSMSFGQITPFRANNIFEDFWGDRWNELEQADELFKPMLRNKWSRNLDRALNQGWNEDWSNVKDGESQKVSTYYTNKNGVQSKKTVSTKTKYENGVPKTETTEQYEFPDGKKEVRKMLDDGKGNVTSNVYHLKKGENLPITN